MRQVEIGGYKRVSKVVARKLYEAGSEVNITPCNIRPDNMWGFRATVSLDSTQAASFNRIVDAFDYYNCTGRQTGRYPAYYIKCD